MRLSSSIIATLFVSAFVFSNVALAAFSDVDENHEHHAAVSWLEARGVIQGYDDGTFQPDWDVNRAEALKIVLLGSGVDVSSDSGSDDLFPDVAADQWFYPYVEKALELEIVEGYSDGYFRPDQTINLAEMLKIITLVRGVEVNAPNEAPYPDVDAEAWFAPYVDYGKSMNFIEAHDDGYLHADYSVNRGDLVEIIYRFSYVEENGLDSFDISTNWPEHQHSTDHYTFKSPFGWAFMTTNTGEVILWHQDEGNGQVSWDRTYPNSAVVTISIDPEGSGYSSSSYFSRIENSLSYEATINQTTIAGRSALVVEYTGDYEAMRDVYLSLDNGEFLVAHGTYGTGPLSEQLNDYIAAVQNSILYSVSPEIVDPETTVDPDETVDQARANIQVDGEGQVTLDLFPDLELIETDAIGIGTGPVDYYYSVWADVTLKYERSFDVILDIEDGQTTAF